MSDSHLVWQEKTIGDTAVDGLMAGPVAGLTMALFLVLAGLLDGRQPHITLGYFDPAQAGNWLTGLLAHLAVSAIYGVIFALLLRLVRRIRPPVLRPIWLWGVGYGLVLWGLTQEVVFSAVPSPLTQIASWQMAVAHLLYGLVLGLRLHNK
jgi:hypothetical protein